jgi:hypothetical protein
MDSTFEGGRELGEQPSEVSVEDQLHWTKLREAFRRSGGRPRKNDPVREFGMKRTSGLFRLPY